LYNTSIPFSQLLKPTHKSDAYRDAHGRFATSNTIGSHLNDMGLWHFETPDFTNAWKQHLPNVTPKEFMEGMFGKTDAHPHNLDNIAKLAFTKAGSLIIEAKNGTLHGSKFEYYKREFHLGKEPKIAIHDLLKLDASARGKGVVKNLFKSILPLYDKMGIKEVHMTAGLEGGAYAWAKYGFNYETPASADIHKHELLSGLNSIQTTHLDKGAHEELETIHKVLEGDATKRLALLSDLKTPNLDAAFASKIKEEVGSKGNFQKLLFTETGYKAVLSLSDKHSMTRLHRYISQGAL
jgi:hypothetical protein